MDQTLTIKSVAIQGMNKVAATRYDLSQVQYFHGPNGAGKSTILNAIQLALLGYIPGEAKTNAQVMKHCTGPALSVELELSDGRRLTRTFVKKGSGASCTVEGDFQDPKELLGELELPIMNFSEFTSLPANQMKDWFIHFLPSDETKIDWDRELRDAAPSVNSDIDEIIASTVAEISALGLSGVEEIQGANKLMKEGLSFAKAQKEALTKTVSSLVRYDETELVSEAEAQNELIRLNSLSNDLSNYNAEAASQRAIIEGINNAKAAVPAETADSDEELSGWKTMLTDTYNKRVNVIQPKILEVSEQVQEARNEVSRLLSEIHKNTPNGTECPILHTTCEPLVEKSKELAKVVAGLEKEEKAASKKVADLVSELNSLTHQAEQMNQEINDLQRKIQQREAVYGELSRLQAMVKKEALVPPTGLTHDEINKQIMQYQDMLAKAKANAQYEEMMQKVNRDQQQYQIQEDAYKEWVKLTSANGLPSRFSGNAFDTLKSKLNSYLTSLFGKEVEANFNLEEKANSFSMGITRDRKYIIYDALSSGEKCIFAIAMMLSLLDYNKVKLPLLLADDIIDHLDDENAKHLFSQLKKIKTAQFICAGVKPCEDSSVAVEIN